VAARKSTAPVRSLQRGLAVLRTVANAGRPMGLGELVERVGLDRSCVFRLASTLTREGFLNQSPRTRQYALGAAIWEIAGCMQRGNPLMVVARKHLAELARRTGETAHLSVRQNDRAVSLEHQLTEQLTGVMMSTGRSEPLYCSAVGKALLADFPEDQVRELLGSDSLPSRTTRTIRSTQALAEECRRDRVRGYSVDDEEYANGVRCVASPVRDYRDEVIAAIGVSAPSARIARKELDALGAVVREIADRMSEEMGRVTAVST